MAESEQSHHQDYIIIGGSTEFGDDDEALEALVELKELTFGDAFNDRDTKIESDDSDGISIHFYHTDENNTLRVYTTEDGHVHIHCQLFKDAALDAHDILETVAEEIGEVEVQHTTAVRFIETPFQSLEFPIQRDTEHEVTGIRISESAANYITQATEVNGVSFVSRDRRFDEAKTLTSITPLGTADWDAIDDFIAEFN